MILDDERMARHATNKTRLIRMPDKGLKQIVTSNFDIRWRDGCGAASEENIFPRCFQKVVFNLVRSVCNIASGAAEGLRIGARPGHRNAVEVGKKRVDHGDITHVVEGQAARGFVLRGS